MCVHQRKVYFFFSFALKSWLYQPIRLFSPLHLSIFFAEKYYINMQINFFFLLCIQILNACTCFFSSYCCRLNKWIQRVFLFVLIFLSSITRASKVFYWIIWVCNDGIAFLQRPTDQKGWWKLSRYLYALWKWMIVWKQNRSQNRHRMTALFIHMYCILIQRVGWIWTTCYISNECN